MNEIYTLSFSDRRARQRQHQDYTRTRHSSTIGISFGSIHLTLGFLSIVFGIVGLVAEFHASKFGTALWSGLIFEVTGATGIIASRRWYRHSYIMCFCGASMLSALTGLLLFALTCVGIANHYVYWHQSFDTGVASVSANVIVLAIIETIVSITSATLSVKAARWRYTPQSRLRSKESVVVRETFMVPGNERHQILVPDVVQSAPGTLVAVHHLAGDQCRHLQLSLDPNSLNSWNITKERHDSWESSESCGETDYYFCPREDTNGRHFTEL